MKANMTDTVMDLGYVNLYPSFGVLLVHNVHPISLLALLGCYHQ